MKRLILILAMLLLPFTIVVAQDNTTPNENENEGVTGLPQQRQFEENTYIRVIHLVDGADTVDVYADGDAMIFESLGFGEAGIWTTFRAGDHRISVVPTGQNIENALLDETMGFGTEAWTTLAIVTNPNTGEPVLRPIQEDLGEFLSTGVRVTQTGHVVAVNALSTNQEIGFNRSGALFFGALAPLGLDDNDQSISQIRMDAAEPFVFDFQNSDSGEVIAELPEMQLVDTETYLFALTDSEPVVIATPRIQYVVANGSVPAPGSLVQTLNSIDFLSPFAEAVEVAGLTEMLENEGPFTLLVPADFVMTEVLNQNRNNPDQLAEVLRSHIIEGDYKASRLLNAGSLNALAGNGININVQGTSPFANNAQMLDLNMPAVNGTIHLIDGTLTD